MPTLLHPLGGGAFPEYVNCGQFGAGSGVTSRGGTASGLGLSIIAQLLEIFSVAPLDVAVLHRNGLATAQEDPTTPPRRKPRLAASNEK